MISSHRDINLYEIKDDLIFGLGGEVGVSYELFPGKDLRMCASAELETVPPAFSRALSALPARFAVTFEAEIEAQEKLEMDFFDGVKPLLYEISKTKREMFGKVGRRTRYFAHIYSGELNPLKLKLLPVISIATKKQGTLEQSFDRNLNELLDASNSFVRGLETLGVKAKRLSTERLLERYWHLLCPFKSANGSRIPEILPEYTLRSQLVSANGSETEGYFFQDGFYHTAVSFCSYPEEVALGRIDRLIETLPIGSRYLFCVLAPEQREMLDKLKIKRQEAQSDAAGEKTTIDFESTEKEKDLRGLIQSRVSGGDGLYLAWAGVLLKERNLEQLVAEQKELLNALRDIFYGLEGVVEDLNHRRFFLASLPFCGHLAPCRKIIPGTTLSALAPISSHWRGCMGGDLIIASRSGQPLYFDVFDKATPQHGMIIGTTRGGKSFFGNLLQCAVLSNPKARNLVIDVGRSFERLTEVLGGAYFDVKIDEKYAINPILPRSSMLKNGEFDKDALAAQMAVLAKICETSDAAAKFVLQKAIERVFQEVEEPLLTDIMRVLREGPWEQTLKEKAQFLIHQLLPYTDGIYSALFSRPSRIRPFEEQLTVFELGDIRKEEKLLPIMVNLIAFSVARELEDRTIRKTVFIDESHRFFKDKLTADLLEQYYREAGKHNASVITASQAPKEFLESPCSAPIRNVSSWAIFFKMRTDFNLMSEFGFTDQAIAMAKGMQTIRGEYSEMLLKFGDEPQIIARNYALPMEYWLATSNADEWTVEKQFRQKNNLSVEESVRKLSVLFPSGVPDDILKSFTDGKMTLEQVIASASSAKQSPVWGAAQEGSR